MAWILATTLDNRNANLHTSQIAAILDRVPGRPQDGSVVLLAGGRDRSQNLDTLRRRSEEATRYIDLDRLAISPQCGFASGMSGNDLSEDQQWRKLEVILETARRVWH